MARLTETPYVERLRAKLQACGVAPDEVSVVWEDDLQDHAITILTPDAALGADQIDGLADLAVIAGGTYLFASPLAQARFDESRRKSPALKRLLAIAEDKRGRLASLGILAEVDSLAAAAVPLASKTRRVEQLAGYTPGTMLEAVGTTFRVIGSPPDLTLPDMERWYTFMTILEAAIGFDHLLIDDDAQTEP